MERVNGQTLRELIQRGERLPISRVVELIRGILDALDYSHKKGIIHRDIKPGNIMITDSGDVKVMDFGIARALDESATMTNTWNVVGTAQYLAPEQATGSNADARSDLYAVGCVFYELMTGRPPFTGETPVAIAYQHVSAELTKATLLQPTLPTAVDDFLAVALAKNPDHRYQSADAMATDIVKLGRGEAITTEIPKAGMPRRNLIVIGALALIAIALGSIFFFGGRSTSVITVPNVVGLTESEARELLADFTVTIERAPNPRIPKDRVAAQLPVATSRVTSGSSITLTLSDGRGESVVPIDIIGKSLEQARALLNSAGLLVARTIQVDSELSPGLVIRILPEPGTSVPAGSSVTLEIASGNVKVPDLIGSSKIQAQTTLTQAGFMVRFIEAFDPAQPEGIVIAQAPAAGEARTLGSFVTVTINTPTDQPSTDESPTP
jgi:serine/threonine-protein kinase